MCCHGQTATVCSCVLNIAGSSWTLRYTKIDQEAEFNRESSLQTVIVIAIQAQDQWKWFRQWVSLMTLLDYDNLLKGIGIQQ